MVSCCTIVFSPGRKVIGVKKRYRIQMVKYDQINAETMRKSEIFALGLFKNVVINSVLLHHSYVLLVFSQTFGTARWQPKLKYVRTSLMVVKVEMY